MPADVFGANYDDPQLALAEWELYRDRVEWAHRQASAPPVDEGG